MAKLTGLEHIRSAIGAFNSGETDIAALERLIGTALATGSVSRLDASIAIRADCNAGAAASDIIDNLGLDDIVVPIKRAAPARAAAAERLATQPKVRAASETRVRIAGKPAPNREEAAQAGANREPKRDPTDKPQAEVAAASTDAVWADPDPTSVAPGDRGLVGQLLGGRYLLERELGRGGMGEVYLASDQEVIGELFAIKVLKPEIRTFPEALPLLREEVRTTRALRHPNIVGVYSLNSDRSHIYMLMEYLEGKPLDALLDQEFGRGMPFSRAWPLILDMCDALAYAHDHSVIHSDLKPSNVFVTLAGRAKLLDFGIARVARTRDGRFDPSTIGAMTLAYASCEMLAGGKPDQSDDVFSLACVIYEMLSGRHPFDLRSALEAREEGYAVTPIPLLAPTQNAALAQALAFDRTKRIATVESLLAGLEPTTAQQATPDRSKDAVIRARRSTAQGKGSPRPGAASQDSRNPSMIVVMGVVAAILVGGFSLLLYRTREHSTALPTSAARTRAIPTPAGGVPASATPTNTTGQPSAPVTTATTQPRAPAAAPALAPEDAPAQPTTTAARTPAIPPTAAAMPPSEPPVATNTQPRASPPAANTLKAATLTAASTPSAANAPAADKPSVNPPTTAKYSEPRAREDDAAVPPVGRHVPPVKPLPDSESSIDSCPYPDQLLRQGLTGSVGVLVYIAPDGGAVTTKVDESSGSDELDAAAARCVQDYGQFSPKRIGPRAVGYWGHMKFNFSFGG